MAPLGFSTHAGYSDVCEAMDGMHFVRDLSIVAKLTKIIIAFCVTGIKWLIGLIVPGTLKHFHLFVHQWSRNHVILTL